MSDDQVRDLLWVIRDDLEFLKTLDYKNPTRTHARVSSSMLRRLFHENLYLMAWKFVRFDDLPQFTAIDLQAVYEDVPKRYIEYAYAGGGSKEGAHHEGHALLRIPKDEADKEPMEVIGKKIRGLIKPSIRKKFTLAEFCQSPSVLTGEASVSRIEVIKYVANKLGGVHWDSKRQEWKIPSGGKFRFLDETHMYVGQLPATFYEVISIAEAVATSEDTNRLIERINEMAPEPQRDNNVLSFREGRTGKYADMKYGNKSAD